MRTPRPTLPRTPFGLRDPTALDFYFPPMGEPYNSKDNVVPLFPKRPILSCPGTDKDGKDPCDELFKLIQQAGLYITLENNPYLKRQLISSINVLINRYNEDCGGGIDEVENDEHGLGPR